MSPLVFPHVVRRLGAVCVCAAALLGAAAVPAQAAVMAPPPVAARAYLLMDVTSGQVLAEHISDEPVEPASLTKLMTAYVVFEALQKKQITLEQTFTVSERAWRMPGSRMFVEPGMQVPVLDLLKGMIVQSGNDATTVLAEGLGGTVEQFVAMMNAQAKALGMNNTGYRNPEGLTADGHTTTARDLATLAMRLMRDFPEYVPLYAIKHYRYPGTPAANDTNRNLLLFRDPSVDGLKTGHTSAAGYCLVATASRPAAGLGGGAQRRLLSVLLGADSASSRATESQKLLNWGYTSFEAVRITEPGKPVVEPKVWKGVQKIAQVGVPAGVVVAVPRGARADVQVETTLDQPLMAPLAVGQQVGKLTLSLKDGTALGSYPLQVLAPVAQAGFVGRAWDSLLLWAE
jgi:serine-type D-Ala-D-Ala carboxypeptidase (penicillin-binding protein 5/6)